MLTCLAGACRALPLLLVASFAMPALAQINQLEPEDLVKAMQTAGLHPELQEDEDGYGPMITGRYDDVNAGLQAVFDGCDEDGSDCSSLILSAGFTFGEAGKAISLDKINEWNVGHFGKAYVDDETMYIIVEVDRYGGTTQENLQSIIEGFKLRMADFIGFIGWKAN